MKACLMCSKPVPDHGKFCSALCRLALTKWQEEREASVQSDDPDQAKQVGGEA